MINKHKVLVVTPGFFPLFGGMEEQCYLLSQAFLKDGYAVDILTEQTEISFSRFEVVDGINVYRLGNIQKRNMFGFAKLLSELVTFMIRRQHEYDFCIIRTLTFHCMVIGLLKFLGLQLKTVVTAETGGSDDDIVYLKKSKLWRILVFLSGEHNFYNAICEDNVKHYRELGFNMKKVVKIYNGLDVSMYKKSVYPQKVVNFMFLGRLLKTKGIFELVEAFKLAVKKRPFIKLLIGGDGLDKDLMLKKIDGCPNIKFLGFINREDRDNFYNRGDCFIQPSYSESFSMVVYEAAVRKRFIISTDVADLKKVFGGNILFCEIRDTKDLGMKMVQVIGGLLKDKINYNGVVDRVDIRNTARQYVSLFS